MQGERFRSFAGAKPQLHDDCRECPWLTLYYGECPKYRVRNVGEAENSLPFFCDSFKMFFEERYVGIEGAARTQRCEAWAGPVPAHAVVAPRSSGVVRPSTEL